MATRDTVLVVCPAVRTRRSTWINVSTVRFWLSIAGTVSVGSMEAVTVPIGRLMNTVQTSRLFRDKAAA